MEFFPFRRPYYYYTGRGMQYAQRPNYINQRENVKTQEENEQTRIKQAVKQEGLSGKFREQTRNINQLEREENPMFEIFGLKLYFDDILIIALIFFLYNEGVRDNLLFISLILLLLS